MMNFTEPMAKILIVDDMSANLQLIESMLEPFGLLVDICTSGLQSIEIIASGNYDLVLMDHIMPGMDGIQTVAKLRSMGVKIPIVALSASGIDNAKEFFLLNHFDDFVSKPVRIEGLLETLKKWLPTYASKLSARSTKLDCKPALTGDICNANSSSTLMKALRTLPELDIDKVLQRIGGDICILERTLRQTARLLPENINILGELAGDRYALAAHGIKGAFRNIGADRLGNMADRLEHLARKSNDSELSKLHTKFVKEARELISKISDVLSLESPAGPKEKGDFNMLKQAAAELCIAAADFDYKHAQQILIEAGDYEYDTEADELISELKLAFERFDFDRASELSEALLQLEQWQTNSTNDSKNSGISVRGDDR